MKHLLLALSLSTLSLSLYAQSVTTTFLHNNGGNTGGAVYFDLEVGASPGVTLNALSLNLGSPINTAGTIGIYTCTGTRTPNLTTAGDPPWSLRCTVNVTAAGAGTPTIVPIPQIALPGPATYGIAIVTGGVKHAYTNGTMAAEAVGSNSASDLVLRAGEASNVPFTPPTFQPRTVNCSIDFTVGLPPGWATSTVLGQGCHTCATSVYEMFDPAGTFDLSFASYTFVPTGGGYAIAPAGYLFVPPPVTANTIALGDDAEATIATSFSFPHACGGSTGTLQVSSNGSVALAAGNGSGATPTVPGLLNAPQTAWWSWHDYDTTASGSGLVRLHVAAGVCYVTWDGVYDKSGTPSRFQFQFHATGMVVLAYDSMSMLGNPHLVGFSPGGPSIDLGGTDLSSFAAVPPLCCSEELPLTLTIDRPSWLPVGTNFVQAHVSNIDPGAAAGLIAYGFVNPNLPMQMFGPEWSGCTLYTDPLALSLFVPNSATFDLPVGFFWPVPAVFFPTVHSQAFTLGVRAQASNGVALNNGPF